MTCSASNENPDRARRPADARPAGVSDRRPCAILRELPAGLATVDPGAPGVFTPKPVDPLAYAAAKRRWDSLSKPLDGLGEFETLVCRLAAMQRTPDPTANKRAVVVMCADNGVVDEGVSQCGKEVTAAVTAALGKEISSLNTLAREARADVLPVDVGVDSDLEFVGVLDRRVRRGTRNIAVEPAMTREEAARAIAVGADIARQMKALGYSVLAAGEMGIGNTTTTTALFCALTGAPVAEVVGRGAGLDNAGLARKRAVVERALQRADLSSITSPRDHALAALCELGGLDIAALVGLALGCAREGLPLILDGAISSVAALAAERIAPGTREYYVPSHRGRELCNRQALAALGLAPFIDGAMALGEGTGAAMLFPLLDMALAFYRRASSFSDAGVRQYERFTQ